MGSPPTVHGMEAQAPPQPPPLTLCLSRESMWLTICIRSWGWTLLTRSWEAGDSTGVSASGREAPHAACRACLSSSQN